MQVAIKNITKYIVNLLYIKKNKTVTDTMITIHFFNTAHLSVDSPQ